MQPWAKKLVEHQSGQPGGKQPVDDPALSWPAHGDDDDAWENCQQELGVGERILWVTREGVVEGNGGDPILGLEGEGSLSSHSPDAEELSHSSFLRIILTGQGDIAEVNVQLEWLDHFHFHLNYEKMKGEDRSSHHYSIQILKFCIALCTFVSIFPSIYNIGSHLLVVLYLPGFLFLVSFHRKHIGC